MILNVNVMWMDYDGLTDGRTNGEYDSECECVPDGLGWTNVRMDGLTANVM